MQVALDPADRKLLIIALALMVALVAGTALVAPPTPAPAPPSSSYSPASDGAKAAYLLLGEVGYNVQRWAQPLSELPEDSDSAALVLADPFAMDPGAEERESLIRFVRRGGRVLFAGRGASSFLPEVYSNLLEPWHAVERAYPAVAVSSISRGVPQVTMAAGIAWNGTAKDVVPLYALGTEAVVVTYELGAGRAVWWASSMPLTNDGIRRDGSLELLLNSLGSPGQRRILWDEYYHGERRSLTSYLAGTPAPWMLLQAGIIYVFLLLAYGRRTGPLRSPTVESRLSPLEFVETLGALYNTAGAASGAVGTVWQRFRFLICSRLGLSPSSSIRQIYDAARERLSWREPGFFDALQHAERGSLDPNINGREALAIVESLEHYMGLLQLDRAGTEEKQKWRTK